MCVSGATFNMPCKVCYSYSFFIGVYSRAPLCDICELVRYNVALLVMLGVAQRKREEERRRVRDKKREGGRVKEGDTAQQVSVICAFGINSQCSAH